MSQDQCSDCIVYVLRPRHGLDGDATEATQQENGRFTRGNSFKVIFQSKQMDVCILAHKL